MIKELDEDQQYEINEQLRMECYNLGNLKEILQLIQDGADIHFYNQDEDSSPVAIAASMNNVELVKFFLKNGVSVTEHNNLALKEASNYDCLDTIQLLIANGAIVEDVMFLNAYNSGNWKTTEYFIKNFNIKVSEQVLERIKNEDEDFFFEVKNIIKTRELFTEISKELDSTRQLEDKKRLKI
jgi:ankyrin repeat protein